MPVPARLMNKSDKLQACRSGTERSTQTVGSNPTVNPLWRHDKLKFVGHIAHHLLQGVIFGRNPNK